MVFSHGKSLVGTPTVCLPTRLFLFGDASSGVAARPNESGPQPFKEGLLVDRVVDGLLSGGQRIGWLGLAEQGQLDLARESI
jgi:hypothetical protein